MVSVHIKIKGNKAATLKVKKMGPKWPQPEYHTQTIILSLRRQESGRPNENSKFYGNELNINSLCIILLRLIHEYITSRSFQQQLL